MIDNMTKQETEKDEEIQERRRQVVFYRTKELTNGQILDQLNQKKADEDKISMSTLEKDIQAIREMSRAWLDDLAADGIVDEWHLGIQRLKDTARELNVMLNMRKDSDNPKSKYVYDGEIRIRILKLRDDNVLAQRQYLLDGPAVHLMKKHFDKTGTYDP